MLQFRDKIKVGSFSGYLNFWRQSGNIGKEQNSETKIFFLDKKLRITSKMMNSRDLG